MSRAPADPVRAEHQADALIAEIGRKVDASCAAIRAEAEREAEALRQRSREKARRQLQRALDEMRATARRRSAQAQAEQETARSRRAAARAALWLSQAWPALGEAIERRWSDRGARAQWIAAQIAQAGARLGGRHWTVRHPAAWSAAEVDALRSALAGSAAAGSTLHGDAALAIGLVIDADGARLDSRPAALLADRAAVQARLLAAIVTGRGASAGESGP
jgi:vacuolar-type H+-ATPase subunit E/Vma4